MASVMIVQGRRLDDSDVAMIRGLLDEHPEWHRSRLSRALCERWDWRNAQGRLKDMAARTLLLKLEQASRIRLPARQAPSPNGHRNRRLEPVTSPHEPIRGPLRDRLPLGVSVVAQRGFVGGVTGPHFVSQRQTLRRDDQRHDDLHAVAALVPAVTEAARIGFLRRRVALETGRGQIVGQHVKRRAEQIPPTLAQHLFPIRALATDAQARGEEGVELKIVPELIAQPARAPGTRAMKFEMGELDLDGGRVGGGWCAVGGKEGAWAKTGQKNDCGAQESAAAKGLKRQGLLSAVPASIRTPLRARPALPLSARGWR